ncbi:DUF2785 domain-containing protein [Streptomyces sp. NPDC058231]|uniref:DUF2785 domain-containing protein n=1 Tax=Streptomyces sp. NPDC058231 TaxID=3346392 RepID=UPI0036EBB371
MDRARCHPGRTPGGARRRDGAPVRRSADRSTHIRGAGTGHDRQPRRFPSQQLDAFTRWYPAEPDLRGRDARLGWLHAAAHGADLLGTFGCHPQVDPAAMLDLASARLLTPTDYLFAQRENERLPDAIERTLTHPQITAEQSTHWMTSIDAVVHALPPGVPTPPHVSKTLHTLRALYVLTGLDRPHPGRPAHLEARQATARPDFAQQHLRTPSGRSGRATAPRSIRRQSNDAALRSRHGNDAMMIGMVTLDRRDAERWVTSVRIPENLSVTWIRPRGTPARANIAPWTNGP